MPEITTPSPGPSDGQSMAGNSTSPGGINDALVRLIADRVYQQLLQELQYEHERLRLVSKQGLASRFRRGGR